jgi:hypothetical protein
MPSPGTLRVLMATRRSDEQAHRAWQACVEMVRSSSLLTAVLIDRTEQASASQFLQSNAFDLLDEGRVQVVRQTPNDSIREIFSVWKHLDPLWTLTLHDDDTWQGIPALPSSLNPRVSLYTPTIHVCEEGQVVRTAHRWTSQHALFGASTPSLQRAYLDYLCSAPMVIGGEDLLLLFMADQMGFVRPMPGYTYFWNADNWLDEEKRKETTRRYANQFDVPGLDAVSGYVLFQSLDRLASCHAMAPYMNRKSLHRSIRTSMRTFWPIVDVRGHFAYSISPRPIREGLLRGRGQRPMARLTLMARRRTPTPAMDTQSRRGWLPDVDTGEVRLTSVNQVLTRLLPELELALGDNEIAVSQVKYWERCIRSLSMH